VSGTILRRWLLCRAKLRRRASLIASQPAVGEQQDVTDLVTEYADNEQFARAVSLIPSRLHYAGMRRMRGDGNCFYRGWLWSLFHALAQHGVTSPMSSLPSLYGGDRSAGSASASSGGVAAPDAGRPHRGGGGDGMSFEAIVPVAGTPQEVYERLLCLANEARDVLLRVGFEPIVVDDFQEAFQEVLVGLPHFGVELATEPISSDMDAAYLMTFARYLASASVQEFSTELSPLLESLGEPDMAKFRRKHVEASSSEADHAVISCLAAFTGIPLAIVSLSSGGEPQVSVFPHGALPSECLVHLLHRPGHFDVLLPSRGTASALEDALIRRGSTAGASASASS
jgi:hypothetical protein